MKNHETAVFVAFACKEDCFVDKVPHMKSQTKCQETAELYHGSLRIPFKQKAIYTTMDECVSGTALRNSQSHCCKATAVVYNPIMSRRVLLGTNHCSCALGG